MTLEEIPNESETVINTNGPWSASQFSKEFTSETTTGVEYGQKCTQRQRPYIPIGNISPCKCCPIRDDTTNRVEYRPKPIQDPCYPNWICNDDYRKPDINMERCTTYTHFYKPYCIEKCLKSLSVESPNAIPFCTTNKLCYSCHDPEPFQKTPVEMKDSDPWPIIKRVPFRYTDSIQTDPCAPLRDDTTYKTDYYAKSIGGCRPSFRPLEGYIPTLVPFNDDTTMKLAYPPYTLDQYKDAFGNAGNPNGIYWGPFKCPPEKDKCLPHFIAPYGNPLKPFLSNCPCPCGPFDNRSSYNKDFIFRNRDIVAKEEEDICRKVEVAKGGSLTRSSFIAPGGKKAAPMPPPISKGYRCLNPCSVRLLDTLYRFDYYDFTKRLQREKLELYRGHSTKSKTKPKPLVCNEDDNFETQFIYIPVPGSSQQKSTLPVTASAQEEIELPQRYKDIPYSGADIVNRAAPTIECRDYK